MKTYVEVRPVLEFRPLTQEVASFPWEPIHDVCATFIYGLPSSSQQPALLSWRGLVEAGNNYA